VGAMTSELKPVLHIDEFVSGGPKNYAYKTVNPATGERGTVCKVRGITLNYSASRHVNFNAMRDMILQGNDSDRVTVHNEHKIKRKRAGGRIEIITEPEDKMYRIFFQEAQASRQYIRPFWLYKRTLRGRDASHE
jgi:hypothetical protein